MLSFNVYSLPFSFEELNGKRIRRQWVNESGERIDQIGELVISDNNPNVTSVDVRLWKSPNMISLSHEDVQSIKIADEVTMTDEGIEYEFTLIHPAFHDK